VIRLAALICALFLMLSISSLVAAPRSDLKGSYLVYVGAYTGPSSKGIYAFRFNAATGQATRLGLVAETANPSFLAIDPSQRFLYAVNEISDYQGENFQKEKTGSISAYSIDRTSGKLSLLNRISSRGEGPCYISLDKTGKFVLVTDYDSGSVAVFPVLPDGKLGEASAVIQHHGHGPDPKRQEGPHPHQIEVSDDNRFAIVPDLGLDQLLLYRFDPAKGTLAAADPPFAQVAPSAGPRHFVFGPSNKFLYVINEMASTVTGFSYNATAGTLRQLATVSTLPGDFKGTSEAAEIAMHPNGKFLYGSNRGYDSIASFAITAKTGTLKSLEIVPTGGKTPRHFEIAPGGDYLFAANQESNNVVLFKIDKDTGRLAPTGQVLEVPAPVCVKFVAVE
jgi:6-phosphogluconolactonase